jgi:hypothetical protein
MQVTFKGEKLGEWTGKPTLKEARQLKRDLGLLPNDFAAALNDQDPDAMSWLVALLIARKAGADVAQGIDWEDIDGNYDDVEVEMNKEEEEQILEVLAEMERAKAEGEQMTPQQSANVVAMRRQLNGAKPVKPATPKKRTPSSRAKPRATGSTSA